VENPIVRTVVILERGLFTTWDSPLGSRLIAALGIAAAIGVTVWLRR
jgi:hypothetical protein